MEPKWLIWARRLQSIAQAGLTYSRDKYDIERFHQIRDIAVEMVFSLWIICLRCLLTELPKMKLKCVLKPGSTIILSRYLTDC